MHVPNLTGYDLLVPLDEEGRTWLGSMTGTSGRDGIDLVLIEKLSDEFLGRDDLLEKIVEGADEFSGLHHTNLYRTHAAGYVDGDFSIVHQFPVGESLDRLLTSGVPPLPVVLRIVSGLLEGLAHVHGTSGAVHGAINPKVIHVGWDGTTRLSRLGTERLVRRVRHNWGRLNPRQLSYLSPEHCMNDPRSRRTDVFNVGIVLWELLTGRVLFEEEDEFERMRAICESDAPPPTRYNESIPPLLNSLTLKALAIEPEKRFPDAVRLREVFQSVLDRSQSAGTERDAVEFVRSVDAERYRRWKRLERARQQRDLDGVLEAAAGLYGIDLDRADLGSTESPQAGTLDVASDEPTQKLSDDVKREIADGSSSEQGLEESTQDGAPHPVAKDFEVDEDSESPNTTVDEALEELGGNDEWMQDRLEAGDASESGDLEEFSEEALEGFDPFADEVEEETSAPNERPEERSRTEESEEPIADVTIDEPPPTDAPSPGDVTIDEPPPSTESDEQTDGTSEHSSPEPQQEAEPRSAHELILDDETDAGGDDASQSSESEPDSPTRDLDEEAVMAAASGELPAASEPDGSEPDGSDRPSPEPTQRTRSEPDPEESLRDDLSEDLPGSDDFGDAPEPEHPPEEDFDDGAPSSRASEGSDPPDAIASEMSRMSIDDWLEEEDDEREPHVEPFPLEDVIEDKGESEQARVKRPALEIIRLGREQPLDVTVLRGRDRWSKEGVPVKVRSRGTEATVELQPPSSGWVARAQNPAQRRELPNPPAHLKLQPGDVAEVTDGEIRYRFRFFHPPKSPHHVERENFGMSLGIYGVAFALAVILHAVAAVGILTLQSSFGVAMSVKDKPRKEIFAKGKLKKPEEKEPPEEKKKDKPKPPEPPEPQDPAEQKANVPEKIQKEIEQKLDEKQEKSEDETKAEALASALQGSNDSEKESVGESISNIDAVDSPSGTSSEVEIGGKLEGTEGTNVKMETGSEATELGEIGSQLGEGAGDLKARDKKEKVRGTVDSVQSQAEVEGRLARAKVAKVVRQHNGEIQGCYEQELLNSPGLSGKVTFEWTITRSGNVAGARQKSSTLGSGPVSNCILQIIRGMTFPKPKGGSVTIAYPFMFRSGG